ncbi:MAG: hypothetical protein JSV91_12280 [Phycisphaerales bacterium]|nr:MAG: hypothetical protein JSV91_12280 [Phycisphaerales bacterium]
MEPINPTTAPASALRALTINRKQINATLEKLATGHRINRAADDPAGLITSENLRAVLAALEAETRSLQRTDHVASTAEGAMSEMSDLLVRAEGLATAAANTAGMSSEEQQAIQMELDSVVQSIDRIAGSTNFNGNGLLDGTATLTAGGASVTIDNLNSSEVGEAEIDGQEYHLADISSGGALNPTGGSAEDAQRVISAARTQIATMRGELGAFQRHTVGSALNSVEVTIENIAAAEAQIRDTDFAAEAANLARLRVLQDASMRGIAMNASQSERILALLS